MGATEQLFGPLRGEFEQNSNAPKIQMPEGLKFRFDWYISGFKKEAKKENILKDREVERNKERKREREREKERELERRKERKKEKKRERKKEGKKERKKRNNFKDIIDHRSYTHNLRCCEIKA